MKPIKYAALGALIIFGIMFLYSCGSVPSPQEITPPQAGAVYGYIAGTVIDRDTKKPIKDATVDFLYGPSAYPTAYTDQFGRFSQRVLAGTYTIKVSKVPFYAEVLRSNITVGQDEIKDLGEIALESKQPPGPPF